MSIMTDVALLVLPATVAWLATAASATILGQPDRWLANRRLWFVTCLAVAIGYRITDSALGLSPDPARLLPWSCVSAFVTGLLLPPAQRLSDWLADRF